VVLWDLADRSRPHELPGAGRHSGDALAVTISADDRWAASVGADKRVLLWTLADVGGPRVAATLTESRQPVRDVAFSRDGRLLAAASGDEVLLWSLAAAPRLLARWQCGERPVSRAVAFSPDGRSLACGSYNSVPIWNITDPERPALGVETKLTGTPYDLAFSPDGRVLAVGGSGLALWSTTDGRQVSSLTDITTRGRILSIAFSRDGRRLAAASEDRTTSVYDVSDTQHPVLAGAPFGGHNAAVSAVGFGPEGRTLITASIDFTVRLWDVADPADPQALTNNLSTGRSIYGAAVSARGDLIAAATAGGRVVWWNLAAFDDMRRDPARRACAFVARGLNQGEWARYVRDTPYQETCERGR